MPESKWMLTLDTIRSIGVAIFVVDFMLKVAYYHKKRFVTLQLKQVFYYFVCL